MTTVTRMGTATVAAMATTAATTYWRRYRRPTETPPGTVAAPLVWSGADNIPLVGLAARLKSVITDPVGLVVRSQAAHGDFFTLRIPTFADLTYVNGGEHYRKVLTLPTDHATLGPVLGNVPTVGYWFPREQTGPETLQRLILLGRRMMADMLPSARVNRIPERVPEIIDRQAANWPATVDLSEAIYRIVYELVGRYFVGDEIWDRFGARLTSYYRAICDGIDVFRATLASTPYHYLMPEYRATRKLYRLIRDELPAYRGSDSPLLRAIDEVTLDGKTLATADRHWMFMYVLWNATNYPGSYTYWTLVDILSQPGLADRVRSLPTEAARTDLLRRCLLETVRLYPVSSLVRFLDKPYEFERDEVKYHVPAGQLLGVFPAALNRDPDRVPGDTDAYDPDRYLRTPAPKLAGFGRGPFGCIAQPFSEKVTASVLDELLNRYEFTLLEEPPTRRVRVHQTYPGGPLTALVIPRRVRQCEYAN